MVDDLSQEEIEELVDLSQFRTDFPELMQEGDWERYNELRDMRFEGE